MNILGTRIAEARRARGLQQDTLAVQAGIHPNTLARIEQGRANPSVLTLRRIAEALEVTSGSLLDD